MLTRLEKVDGKIICLISDLISDQGAEEAENDGSGLGLCSTRPKTENSEEALEYKRPT